MATLLRANRTQTEVLPSKPPSFTLEEMQVYVGGFVQYINLQSGKVMVMNEDGKMMRLPANPMATLEIVGAGTLPEDYVVGDVLICSRQECGYEQEDDEG